MNPTVDYTHKNHFKFGYDNVWYVPRTSRYQTWMCEYGIAEDTTLTVKEANRRAAIKIQQEAQQQGLDVYLLLSGGADSEVAARAFLDANVPFTAAILKYKDNANWHEAKFAHELCDKYNIPKLIIDLDPTAFFESDEFETITSISQTRSGQLACTMWGASQIPGYVVLGQGEPYLYRQFGQWWFREREMICSWYKYWVFAGLKGAAGFHQYTPDQMLAYLTDPIVLDLINSNKPAGEDLVNNADVKHLLYQTHYPDSDLINRKKYTGFEKLPVADAISRTKLFEKFPFHLAEHAVEYTQMIRNLKGETN
jgi:hypothetical protein